MTNIVRNMLDPETREFWIRVEQRVKAFEKRAPHWLICDGCEKCKPELSEDEDNRNQ